MNNNNDRRTLVNRIEASNCYAGKELTRVKYQSSAKSRGNNGNESVAKGR